MVTIDRDSEDSKGRFTNSRRRALKGLGAAGLGILAGCTGGGGDGSSGDGSGGESGDGNDGGSNSGDGGDGSDFPSKDIRAIIPFGTGGGFDFYVRTLAQYLPNHLPNDVDVVAENVTGSTGRIAANEVYSSDDPHTFMLLHGDAFTRAQVFEGTDFDLTEMSIYPQVVVSKNTVFVGNDSGIESWDDYVTGVQNHEITFTTTGAADDPLGTGPFVNIQIGENSGLWTIDDVMESPRISFEGQGEAFTAIKRGEGDARVTSFSSGYQYSSQGTTTPLLHLDMEPPEPEPDLQTLADIDIENAETISDATASPFRIFAGPPGIDEEKANVLRQAITDTIKSDEYRTACEEADRPISYENSQEAADTISTLIETYEGQKELFEPYLNY